MDDLVSEFITETTESLALLDSELIKLEQHPGDEKILSNIFRIVHTIKGTCGFLGLLRLQAVAHASENVLGKIRDRELEASPQAVSLVLESLDTIKSLVDHLAQKGAEADGDDSALIGRLNLFAEGKSSSGASDSGGVAHTPAANGDMSAFFKGDDELDALIASQSSPKAVAGSVTAAPKEPAPVAPVSQEKPAAKAESKAESKAEAKAESKDAAATQSIRVNLDVLESLMQMVGELVLTRNQLMQIVRTREDKEIMMPLQQLSHITSELQEGVMKTRMQPIGSAWSKFPRLVRDLSMELGKKIELRMLGAETELDRQLLELIKDPLTHMVRNSCDHGLELPTDRKAACKDETGTVTLSAYHEGGHIIIDIFDDGRGLNVTRIREKILANGLATAAELNGMSEQQIMMFIFRAGFSTAEKVTSVSGRGVGMDVVRTNIEKMGGTVELSSELGKGTKFSIKIPLTLAIVSVLLVEAGEEKLAIPQINVMELIRAAQGSEYAVETINGAPVLRLREKLLPLVSLRKILGLKQETKPEDQKETFIIVCRVGGCDFGIIVDRVYDTEEIVVKPVSEALKAISLYSGNTILGDGSVIMILDPNGIVKTIDNVDLSDQQDAAAKAAHHATQDKMGFLLVSSGNAGQKAVPLELVSRLEKIAAKDIEMADGASVVQYRGDLMRLTWLDAKPLELDGEVSVIVFNYDKQTIGLVVDSILDIVNVTFDLKLQSKERGCLGSMVINGKTTDVVDVAFLLASAAGVVEMSEIDRQKAKQSNILLVEDSPFFRNLVQPVLSAVGYKVTMAENGVEAMKVLSSRPNDFNVIVTDIEMPLMNGLELTAACRKNPQTSRLPIIAYTSLVDKEMMKKGESAGLNKYIQKTDRTGLLEAISQCIAIENRGVAV